MMDLCIRAVLVVFMCRTSDIKTKKRRCFVGIAWFKGEILGVEGLI